MGKLKVKKGKIRRKWEKTWKESNYMFVIYEKWEKIKKEMAGKCNKKKEKKWQENKRKNTWLVIKGKNEKKIKWWGKK